MVPYGSGDIVIGKWCFKVISHEPKDSSLEISLEKEKLIHPSYSNFGRFYVNNLHYKHDTAFLQNTKFYNLNGVPKLCLNSTFELEGI